MKKQLLIAFALLTFFCPGLRTARAQSTGEVKGMKTEKSKTTPAPTEARQPSPADSAKGKASGFKEVTKKKFKEFYFRLGGGKRTGWTAEYWEKFFENDDKPGWKYMVEEPKSDKHNRMYIVSDTKAKEHRMYFMTEEEEDW